MKRTKTILVALAALFVEHLAEAGVLLAHHSLVHVVVPRDEVPVVADGAQERAADGGTQRR